MARLTAAPTIAGRERLAEALGQSVLVQLMLAMTFVAGAFLVYMAQQSQISVQEMNISALQSERTQLVAQNTNLRITATNLQSITRIDAIATSQLHMTKPDIRSAVWITPVVPRVPVLRPAGVDATIAGRKSQPLAWMEHAFHIIRSSL